MRAGGTPGLIMKVVDMEASASSFEHEHTPFAGDLDCRGLPAPAGSSAMVTLPSGLSAPLTECDSIHPGPL
jgi:hypothetical protein